LRRDWVRAGLNAADLLGRNDRGEIAAGKLADLVAVRAIRWPTSRQPST
jgi:imidazolonepropionase-like amidohydrolase